jgi:hypothetical protein
MRHLLAALGALQIVIAHAQPASISIPPLTVRPPVGDEWQVVRQTATGVVFRDVKAGDQTDTIAYVSTASFDPQRALSDFSNEAKDAVQKYLRGPDANVLSSTIRPTTERPYPCARVRAEIQPTTPEAAQRTIRTMLLLLCRTPGAEAQGFVLGFTFTALPSSNQAQEAAAEAFFRSVHLSKK